MVHYAHMRAADLDVDVNFRQGLAEATGFPAGYFDMVVSFIIHHEVPNTKNTEIIKEVARVLRSGGIYYPVDAYTANLPPKDAYGLFNRWWDHRWNNEVWFLQHMDYDLVGDLERFGMAVTKNGPAAQLMRGWNPSSPAESVCDQASLSSLTGRGNRSRSVKNCWQRQTSRCGGRLYQGRQRRYGHELPDDRQSLDEVATLITGPSGSLARRRRLAVAHEAHEAPVRSV